MDKNQHKNLEDMPENLAWEEISTEHIVQDQWIDFKRSDYRFPDGKVFGPFYSYSRRDYCTIVASDEEGDYLCVRQFRQGIRQVTTEFPAGGIERKDGIQYGTGHGPDVAEDALEAAKRELLEETGLTAHRLELTQVLSGPDQHYVYPNGDEVYNVDFVFFCRDWSGTPQCQPGEVEQLRFFPWDQLPPNLSAPTRTWLADWAARHGKPGKNIGIGE